MSGTTMTRAEREAFLAEARVAILAIAEPGRGPLAVPVWYDYRPGGDLWFLTQADSQKGRLLQAAGRLSLCVQDPSPPYRYVSVEGPIAATRPYDIDEDLKPMAQRYLGEAGGADYARRMKESGGNASGILVTLHPERWLTVDYGKRA